MTKIIGTKALQASIRARTQKTDNALQLGLNMGGLFLQRESQKIVPEDTGTLLNSAVTRADPRGGRPSTIVGYGTNYGLYVHENLEARHVPGKTAKFLERPLREKRARIMEIVAETTERLL